MGKLQDDMPVRQLLYQVRSWCSCSSAHLRRPIERHYVLHVRTIDMLKLQVWFRNHWFAMGQAQALFPHTMYRNTLPNSSVGPECLQGVNK